MLSGWFDALDVYIGLHEVVLSKGREFVHVKGKEQDVLDLLRKGIKEIRPRMKGLSRVRIWLAGGICDPLEFKVPDGLRSNSELVAVALASASAGDEIALEPARKGFGIAASAEIVASFKAWAKTEKLHLVSVRPIWALPTEERTLHRNRRSLAVVHSDHCAMLVERIDGTTGGESSSVKSSADLAQALARWRMSEGLDTEDISVIHFSPEAREEHLTAAKFRQPKRFYGCWSVQ